VLKSAVSSQIVLLPQTFAPISPGNWQISLFQELTEKELFIAEFLFTSAFVHSIVLFLVCSLL